MQRELIVLTILAINVNSLIHNSRRFNVYKTLQKNNIDVSLISEAKLKNCHSIYFPGYTTVRNDIIDEQRSGGTAIFIKKKFNHSRIELKCINLIKNIETTIIKIKLSNNKIYL